MENNRIESLMAKRAVKKIGWRNWAYISKKNTVDQDIGRTMFDIGRGIKATTAAVTNTCGEEVYMNVRNQFVEMKLVEPIEIQSQSHLKAKTKAVKLSSADKIRQQNTANKMAIEIADISKSNGKINFNNNFDSRYVELSIMKLISHAKGYVIEHKRVSDEMKKQSRSGDDVSVLKLTQANLHNNLIEIIIGYKKLLEDKSNRTFYPNISTTCLADFSKAIEMVESIIKFDMLEVISTKKQLLFKTKYDKLMYERQIDLYPSQREIFDFITTEKKCLGLVHTMLGSGKTEMIRPLCGWAMSNLKSSQTKILYCCPNEAVLLEVARMVYNLGVPFGLVIYNVNQKKIDYKWSSFCTKSKEKESAILYIADIYCAKAILSEPRNNLDYVLVADELTKDADSIVNFQSDSKYSVITEYFIDIMKILPSRSLIMSATLPTYEQTPELYDAAATPLNATIKSFTASDAKIGCAMIDSDGYYYAPHFDSVSANEIKNILSVIKTNPFVGRFYTYEILLAMIDINKSNNLPVPDLKIAFANLSNAKQNNIQKLVYDMLDHLSTQSDDMVKKVCAKNNYAATKMKPVDLSYLLTRDINRFNKGTIVFSSNPVDTAISIYADNFDKFLRDDNRSIFEQIRFDCILAKYDKEMQLHRDAIERVINKLDDSAKKNNKSDGKKERTENSDSKMAHLYETQPKWDFPAELQIGSLEHAERADRLFKQYTYSAPDSIATMTAELLPRDSSVSDHIQMLLASGIGIYTTNDDRLDDIYLKAVLDLAKSGLIKMIFADSSIAYGTNLSVSDIVIIDTGIESKHSMKTMFQMMGRAGRGGNLSYEARIYTTSDSNNLINRIGKYTRSTLDEGDCDEVQNILRAYRHRWN